MRHEDEPRDEEPRRQNPREGASRDGASAEAGVRAEAPREFGPRGRVAGESAPREGEPPEGRSLHDFHQKVARAFHAQRACVRPTARELGLGEGQPRILSFVAAKGAASQNEIARFFGIDPGAVSRMLDALSRNGFVTVTTCAENRRTNTVKLTRRGHAAIRAWDLRCAQVEEAMLDGFTEGEREAFGRYLERAEGNLIALRNREAHHA